mmetsp:Transcript_113265/g.293190  ORF Transcript_113265/g.293190 Transcript_113265/m.293190 type:complete len:738 (-) Transcript_113265:59-2272(-)
MRPGTASDGGSPGRQPPRLERHLSEPCWPPKLKPLTGRLGTGGSRPNSAGQLLHLVGGGGGDNLASPSRGAGGPSAARASPSSLSGKGRACPPALQDVEGGSRIHLALPVEKRWSLNAAPLPLSGSASPSGSFPASPSRGGLSPNASAQNRSVGRRWSALLAHQKDADTTFSTADKVGAAVLDEDAFLTFASGMENSLEALKSRLANVELGGNREAGGGGGHRGSIRGGHKDSGDAEDDAAEKLAEKFLLYKMVRKIEPEIPPLDRSVLEGSALPPPPQSIVKWNATPMALSRSTPDLRLERLKSSSTLRAHKGLEVAKSRTRQLEECHLQWVNTLARKMRQAEVARERKSKTTSGQPVQQVEQDPSQRWFAILAVVGFVREMQMELQFQKNSESQVAPQQSVRSSRMKRMSSTRSMADSFFAAKSPEDLQRMSDFIWARMNIWKHRKQTRLIVQSLTCWQVAGRTFMVLKRLMLQIRCLQRWWRECSVRLRQYKEMVSRRWVVLERAEIDRRRRDGDDSASPLDDDLRINFIDNELRALRYLVLPRIELWEIEKKRWADNVRERAEMRAARKVLGQEGSSPDESFSWPPWRPSYMPPRHPNHSIHARDCPETCIGRHGDRMVLAMVQRAWRTQGEGWTEIPVARGGAGAQDQSRDASSPAVGGDGGGDGDGRNDATAAPAAPTRRRGSKGRQAPTDSEAAPYGVEVDEEEMRRWGVHEGSMPCLDPSAGVAIDVSC